MINFKPVNSSTPFDRYKEAVGRKNAGAVRTTLERMEDEMRDNYNDYQSHFDANTIEWMVAHGYKSPQKEALLSLFSSQAKLVTDFREEIYRLNPQTYNMLCPYCAKDEASTTEHILPKDMYPEFAVNVLNLIPCCAVCNGKKLGAVRDNKGRKLVINFYTDKIPAEQFLYAEITISGLYPKAEYKLMNPENRIEASVFNLIERHFSRLDLLKRYDAYAIRQLPQLVRDYTLEQFQSEEEYDRYARKQLMKLDGDINLFGINRYDQVLLRAVATSAAFKHWVLANQ